MDDGMYDAAMSPMDDITHKAKDVLPGMQRGIVVEFTDILDGGDYGETHGFEPHMRAVLANCKFDKEDECWILTFDFSDFAEYNKRFETPGWSDNAGGFDLKWSGSVFYPKSKRDKIFIQPEDPVPFAVHRAAKEDYMLERYKRSWGALFRFVGMVAEYENAPHNIRVAADAAIDEAQRTLDGLQ